MPEIVEQARAQIAAKAAWAMLRAVIGTNCLVSDLLARGTLVRQIVARWQKGTFKLLSSPATRAELAAVLAGPAIQRLAAVPLDETVSG